MILSNCDIALHYEGKWRYMIDKDRASDPDSWHWELHIMSMHCNCTVVGKTANLTESPWDKNKGSLITESFSLWLFPQKNVPNHYKSVNLKSNFSWNSIAKKLNEILNKILHYEARAEFCQEKKMLWDVLTFRAFLLYKATKKKSQPRKWFGE